MAKATSAHPERTRPSFRAQSQSLLENTPILFRLPVVELQPLPPVQEEMASTILRTFTEPQQAASLPDGALSDSAPATVTGSDSPETSDISPRSWWEHWTSGVVMILLTAAALAAGILIYKSSSSPANATIASDNSLDDFGNLESISVPSIVIAEPSLTVSQENTLANDLANSDVPAFSPQLDLSRAPAEQLDSESLVDALSSDLPLSFDSGEREQMATARLLEPTPSGSPQQDFSALPNLSSPNDHSQSGAPSWQQGALSAQPAATQLGQSPSLYDDASMQKLTERAAEQPSVVGEGNPAPAGKLDSADPNLSLPAFPTFGMPNLAGDNKTTNPTTTTVSTSVPGIPVPQADTSLRVTATPDSNEEEIIRAYLELTQGSPASDNSNSDSLNRYQNNPR